MNPVAARSPLLTLLLTLLLALWVPPVLAASIYRVEGVRVVVPPEGNGDLRQAGLARARLVGLERLFHRLLSRQDREGATELLTTLKGEAERLVQQVVVRQERRRPEGLAMTVDVGFDAAAIRQSLVEAGLSYNETPYPPALLLLGPEGGGALPLPGEALARAMQQAAECYGITLRQPLGDVDDMVNLAPGPLAEGSPELYRWAAARYGVEHIWSASGQAFEASPAGSWEPARYAVRGVLEVGRREHPPQRLTATVQGPFQDREEMVGEPLLALAQQWLETLYDQWIQAHAVRPELGHRVALEVRHLGQLHRYGMLMKGVRGLPGVTGVQVVEMSGRGTSLVLDYQGHDQRLMRDLEGLGVAVTPAEGALRATFP